MATLKCDTATTLARLAPLSSVERKYILTRGEVGDQFVKFVFATDECFIKGWWFWGVPALAWGSSRLLTTLTKNGGEQSNDIILHLLGKLFRGLETADGKTSGVLNLLDGVIERATTGKRNGKGDRD